MFDDYVLTKDSLTNVRDEAGELIGYEVRTRIPYYRGVPLSMVDDIELEVDGQPVDRDAIRFSVDGGRAWFDLEVMETVTLLRWEYEDEALIRVLSPGGLAPGEHEVALAVHVRVAYMPAPLVGRMTRRLAVA